MSDVVYWERRIADVGKRVAALLRTDAEQFFAETVRERFVAEDAVADALDDAGVAHLKTETARTAGEVARAVAERLDRAAWLAVQSPEPGADLRDVPVVAEVFEAFEGALNTFLADHGLAPDAPIEWRVPKRFIDGDNLISLARTLWKAVAQRASLQSAKVQASARQTEDARRRRWDEA